MTLVFHGSGLRSGLGVHFQPADGIAVSKVQPVSDSELRVEIKIASGTAATARTITLQHGRDSYPVPGSFTITSATGVMTQGESLQRGGFISSGARSFSPGDAASGQTLTLSVLGSDLKPDSALEFLPAGGVRATAAHLVSTSQLDFTVVVDAGAVPGPRTLSLRSGLGGIAGAGRSIPGQFIVRSQSLTLPLATAPSSPARVTGISPAQISPGATDVELVIRGEGFTPSSHVVFSGTGILSNNKVQFISSNELRMHISVHGAASTGPRDLVVADSLAQAAPQALMASASGMMLPTASNTPRLGAVPSSPGKQPAQTSPTMSVESLKRSSSAAPSTTAAVAPLAINSNAVAGVATVSGRQPAVARGALQITPAVRNNLGPVNINASTAPAPSVKKGVVTLKSPPWGICGGGEFTSCDIPVVNDSISFQWSEQNPGTADYYEIHFFSNDGITLLASEKIQPDKMMVGGKMANVLPTYYHPSTQVLTQLLTTTAKNLVSISSAVTGSGSGGSGVPDTKHGNHYLHEADIQWSISGYHYQKTTKTSPTVSAPNAATLAGTVALVSGGSSQSSTTPTVNLGSKVTIAKTIQAPAAQPLAGEKISQGALTATTGAGTTSATAGSKTTATLNTSATASTSAVASALDPGTPVEVEVSEHWALKRPKSPTGMSCPTSGMKSALTVGNAEDKGPGNDPNNYIMDRMFIYGSFSLAGSPWDISAVGNASPYQGIAQGIASAVASLNASNPLNKTGGKTQTTINNTSNVQAPFSYSFKNLFVDWGDGKVQPVTALTNATGVNASPSGTLSLPQDATNPLAMIHQYQDTGTFSVRVYELAMSDVSSGNYMAGSASANNLAQQSYFRLAGALGGGTTVSAGKGTTASQSTARNVAANMNPASLPGGNTGTSTSSNTYQGIGGGVGDQGATVADRAYMIFCYDVLVTNRQDPDATGPLHLQKIAVKSFPGHNPSDFLSPMQSPKVGTMQNMAGDVTQPKLSHAGDKTTQLNMPSVSPHLPTQTAEPPAMSKAAPGQKGAGSASLSSRPGTGEATAVNASAAAALIGGSTPDYSHLPRCSQCDLSMVAEAAIDYYGHGRALLTWKVDNFTVGQEVIDLPSSTQRTNLPRDKSKWPAIIVDERAGYYSPALPHRDLGEHGVYVEIAKAKYDASDNLTRTVQGALQTAVSAGKFTQVATPLGSSGKAMAMSLTIQQGAVGDMTVRSAKAPPKLGILSPNSIPIAGQPSVIYLQSGGSAQATVKTQAGTNSAMLAAAQAAAEAALAAQFGTPIGSERRIYAVMESTPGAPCTFYLPTPSGNFAITALEGKTKRNADGTFSGGGNLVVSLVDGAGSVRQYPPVRVQFQGWQVPDAIHVSSGSLDVQPKIQLSATPAVQGTLNRIHGSANQPLLAEMTLQLKDKTLRIPGQTEVPPSWSSVEAPLGADGSWYKDGLTMPKTIIGATAFLIESSSLAIDLSLKDGKAPGPKCGSYGKPENFVGVHLGNATIYPYTMGMVQISSSVKDWGITDSGICGHMGPVHFDSDKGGGHIKFDYNFDAQGGNYSGSLANVDILMPWLNTHITGNGRLVAGNGKDTSITFTFPSAPAVNLTYGDVSFTAKDFVFRHVENLDWAMDSNTSFTMKAAGKTLASFTTPLIYGFDGLPHFDKAAPSHDVALSGQSSLGSTPVDLANVHMTTPQNSRDIMDFIFSTKLHLSEVMPSTDVKVDYSLFRDGTVYSASKASIEKFTINAALPATNPTVTAAIRPQYHPDDNDRYDGDVDLAMFGGNAVSASFILGRQNGHDYWMTKATLSLEGTPVNIFPPFLTLFRINGGLGHNFGINDFIGTADIKTIQPTIDNSYQFNAGMLVGSSDGFAYAFDGDFTVSVGGSNPGARMDFKAWLLSANHSGNGDFQGSLQYANGDIDGNLSGQLSFLDNTVNIVVPPGAASLHFGHGTWHVYAGKKEGPRIHGRVMTSDADAYVMLGNDCGLAIGGSEGIYLGVGDSSVASAYVSGNVDLGLQVTPQPHLIGDFSESISAGVCAMGACVDGSVTAAIHAEALPIDINATFTMDLPFPLPDVHVKVHL